MNELPAARASTDESSDESKAVRVRLSSFSKRPKIALPYVALAAAISVAIGAVLASAGIVPHPGLGMAGAFAPLFVAWLGSLALGCTVTAGDDGIHVRWLGYQHFYPYDEIDVVAHAYESDPPSAELRIVLHSGKTISLPGAADAIDRVVARVREAQARDLHRPAVEPLASLLDGQQSPRERLRKLRALGAGATVGPRTAVPDDDQLWRIIDSPAASDGERAAAAVALTSGPKDPATQKRLRVVAGRTANPKLRVVIDGLADDEPMAEEQLAEALAEIEQADRRRAD